MEILIRNKRREFLKNLLLVGVSSAIVKFTPSFAQLTTFSIRLVRDTSLSETLSINDCILGTLYLTQNFELSDPGMKLYRTLELPYRNNLNEISAIPKGRYRGAVRTDGTLGWRIELEGVPDGRKFIQIHPGNTPDEIRGCILLGTSTNKDTCMVLNSKLARDDLMKLYGSNSTRPIELLIQ